MKKIILIKYGELTTKKDNRALFIRILVENIKSSLKKFDIKLTHSRVRMFIECDEKDLDEVINRLLKIFGIHSIVIVSKVNNNINDIKNKILDIYKDIDFKTFKVETHRANKEFIYNSPEMNNIIGAFLLKNISNIKVDVHNPEILVKLEIREKDTYIYHKEIYALGGYPVGVLGKGLTMLSGGIDSPVSLFLALKRGIKVETIYFESPPHTSLMARNKVIKLLEKLSFYQPNIKLHVVNFTKIQETIYKEMDPTYMITIMRRMMYRISVEVAKRRKCLTIINGESIGQVASQTLTSINVINSVTNFPIIRPVACMDKLEIIDISKKIGTYEISIEPYEDCCTIFVPKHPVINPKMDKIIDMEKNINFEELINETINNIEIIDVNSIKKELI